MSFFFDRCAKNFSLPKSQCVSTSLNAYSIQDSGGKPTFNTYVNVLFFDRKTENSTRPRFNLLTSRIYPQRLKAIWLSIRAITLSSLFLHDLINQFVLFIFECHKLYPRCYYLGSALNNKTLGTIIIIIMSCRQHGYPWPSYSSPLAGLPGYILCPHIAAVCKFEQVDLLLLRHMWGSIGVHHLWASPAVSCVSVSSNLYSFRDGRQGAV